MDWLIILILFIFIGLPIIGALVLLVFGLIFYEVSTKMIDQDPDANPEDTLKYTGPPPTPDPEYYNLNNVLVEPPYLDTITETTLSTCKKSCSNRPECVGYTWTKGRKCNLLGTVGLLKSHEDYVTLLKYRPESPAGHKFGKVSNYLASTELERTDIQNQTDCEKKCLDSSKCRGYVYIDQPQGSEAKCNIMNDIDTFRVLAENNRYKTMVKFF